MVVTPAECALQEHWQVVSAYLLRYALSLLDYNVYCATCMQFWASHSLDAPTMLIKANLAMHCTSGQP